MISTSFDYYDPTENWIEFRTFLEIAESNYEFETWLIENNYYFAEAADSGQAHLQWKNNIISHFKATVEKFISFGLQQIGKDLRVLQTNKELCLNSRRFPAKPNITMKSALNYAAAMNRIAASIVTNLSNLNLNKIDTNNKNTKANIQIKKMILPSYDGTSEFKQFAKKYFSGGEGTKLNLNSEQCTQLLPIAYQYCTTYESRMKSLGDEVKSIIQFINTDESSAGIQTQTNPQMQNMQQQNSPLNQMASSNPNQNVVGMAKPVNADTNYEYFMRYYFDDISPLQEALPITQHKTISGQKPVKLDQAASKSSAPAGSNVNSKTLSIKRKQIAANTVIDAFNAKMSAMGMIYRDFIYLLRAHIASYKGAVAANEGRIQQQQVPQQQMQQMPKQ